MKNTMSTRNTCVDCIFGEYNCNSGEMFCHQSMRNVGIIRCEDHIKAGSVAGAMRRYVKMISEIKYNEIMGYSEGQEGAL